MWRCIGLATAVVTIGTLGFELIEPNWSYWDALYFTLVTITTVGYGDYGLSEDGKVFASLILLGGIGTFTYSLTTLIQIASDVDAILRRKMRRCISECTNHIIVCGYGRMGRMICQELDRSDLKCVVVERDPEHVLHAKQDDRLVVAGVASEDDTLLAAGVERAQGVVCAVDSDAENMFITVTARELNPMCRVVSRADSPSSTHELEQAGASLVISPHQMAGKTMATALIHPRLARFLNRGDEESSYFELGEVIVQKGSSIVGKDIREVGAEMAGLVFVAVEKADGKLVVQPPGDFQFSQGDVVIFAGSGEVVDRMRSASRTGKPEAVLA